MIGGNGTSHLFFLTRYEPIAPISVAILPNTISHISPPPIILAIRQPTKSPGMAAGVKYGIIVSTSAILNCIGPKLNVSNISTNTT